MKIKFTICSSFVNPQNSNEMVHRKIYGSAVICKTPGTKMEPHASSQKKIEKKKKKSKIRNLRP